MKSRTLAFVIQFFKCSVQFVAKYIPYKLHCFLGEGSARDQRGIGEGLARDRRGIGEGSAGDRRGIGEESAGNWHDFCKEKARLHIETNYTQLRFI